MCDVYYVCMYVYVCGTPTLGNNNDNVDYSDYFILNTLEALRLVLYIFIYSCGQDFPYY